MPARVALAIACALGPGPVVPAPEPKPTSIVWDAPPECPDVAHLRRTIEHYAARGLDTSGALLQSAEGELVPKPGGYRLQLRMEVAGGGSVDRVLDDASCAVLAETAALMIAVTIDPSAATRPPPPKEPTPPPKPEPAPPKPKPAPVVEPRPTTPAPAPRECNAGPRRRDRRPCVALEVRTGMQLGILPKLVGAGIGGDIAVTWARLRLELGASHWFRRPARIGADRSAGGDLQLSVGSAGACARLGRRAFELPLCAGGELGAMHGRGVGIDSPRTERVLWAAAWAGPRALWIVHPRLVLLGGVDLVVPLARYRFEVAGLGVVHRVGPVGGRFRLGLGVRI